jgi:hypothetical protein
MAVACMLTHRDGTTGDVTESSLPGFRTSTLKSTSSLRPSDVPINTANAAKEFAVAPGRLSD